VHDRRVSYDARDDSDPEKKLGEMNRHDRKWRETTGKDIRKLTDVRGWVNYESRPSAIGARTLA